MTLEGKIKRYLRWGRIAQWRHEREARKDQLWLMMAGENDQSMALRLRGFGFIKEGQTIGDLHGQPFYELLVNGFEQFCKEFIDK